MYTKLEPAKFTEWLSKLNKEMEDKEPVRRGCPNSGPCFCTGICHEIIGYRKKNMNPIEPIPGTDSFKDWKGDYQGINHNFPLQ